MHPATVAALDVAWTLYAFWALRAGSFANALLTCASAAVAVAAARRSRRRDDNDDNGPWAIFLARAWIASSALLAAVSAMASWLTAPLREFRCEEACDLVARHRGVLSAALLALAVLRARVCNQLAGEKFQIRRK